MKKFMRKFVYCSVIGMMGSASIQEIDARLPQCMAQRAAELLIEKSGLNIAELSNQNQEVLQIIRSELSNFSTIEQIQLITNNIVEKILKSLNKAINQNEKEEYDPAHNRERLFESIVNILSELQVETGTPAVSQPNEARKSKIARAVYAHILVSFLYNTQNRQVFANWMKELYTIYRFCIHSAYFRQVCQTRSISECFDKIKAHKRYCYNNQGGLRSNDSLCVDTYHSLQKLLFLPIQNMNDISGGTVEYANNLFPCWTGTFTCFMLNNNPLKKAKEILTADCSVAIQQYAELLNEKDSLKKIFNILFILELADEWCLIAGISDTDISAVADFEDQYTCVPVPNTMYYTQGTRGVTIEQGSCLVSTIHNLLNILCKDNNTNLECQVWYGNTNCKGEIKNYLSSDTKNRNLNYYKIPGMTSIENLAYFARLIGLQNVDQYEPTLGLFICVLNEILQENRQVSVVNLKNRICNVHNIIGNQNEQLRCYHQIIDIELKNTATTLQSILQRITAHHDLTVKIYTTESRQWPQYKCIITDSTIKKELTIGIGKLGNGYHAEITNITDIL